MSSSDRKHVFLRQKMCFVQTENMSALDRDYGWYLVGGREVPGSIPGRCGDENWK